METKVQQTSVKNHIEIDGIFLTPEAISTIAGFQRHNNEDLKRNIEVITEVIILLMELEIDHGPDFEQKFPEAKENMHMLTIVRADLKKLVKP